MGGGSWTRSSFATYTSATKGATLDSLGRIDISNVSAQEMFKMHSISADLNPHKVMRECRDTEEHPNTKPVIIALDVTGSMGDTAVEVAKSLGVIMTELYEQVPDIEFMIMGIGDLYCDRAPIQISQFESDIRIAEHLDKVYFEFGGGGNYWESYTAAWYMGLHHTDLDCWKRGVKGTIITLGDERINPCLEKRYLQAVTGDKLQGDVETKQLYEAVSEKYNVHHICVKHGTMRDLEGIRRSFEMLGDDYLECTINEVPNTITKIVTDDFIDPAHSSVAPEGGIAW